MKRGGGLMSTAASSDVYPQLSDLEGASSP